MSILALFLEPPILAQGFMNLIPSIGGFIQSSMGVINGIFSKLKLLTFFSIFVTLGKCIISFFKMLWKTLEWILIDFTPWLLYNPWPTNVFETGKRYDKFVEAAFLPWVIRFFIVLATKVANFPKCFIWYIIDIGTWTLYLPFRFGFWLIDYVLNLGIVKGEHKVWNFMNDIDYYIHGPVRNYFLDQYVAMYIGDKMYKDGEIVQNPKGNQTRKNGLTGAPVPLLSFDNFTYTDKNNNKKIIDVEEEKDINSKNRDKTITADSASMNLGFHIIHFPNSVMETCYSATNFKLADLKSFPMNDFNNFLQCITKNIF